MKTLSASSIFWASIILLLTVSCNRDNQKTELPSVSPTPNPAVSTVEYVPEKLYGYIIDSMQVLQGEVHKNQSVSDILLPLGADHQTIFTLSKSSKSVFDVRKIGVGKKYTVLINKDSIPEKFIYEPTLREYYVFHLKDSIYAEKFEREIQTEVRTLEGFIEHSLSVSIEEQGGSVELTNDFVDVFAWQIDFFRLQQGDHFRVIYEEQSIEGEAIGIGRIIAIYFNHQNSPNYAFAYDQGEGLDYFDESGNSLRKAFLKYPLEFSRISSRYTLSRFHPVQKRWKAHLGTDFAADRGTPIRAVGDGTVAEARYSKYNGNYVKIRHNATYTTQYLHMSNIGKGVSAGTRVRQGQIIGYVGSTGLATGNHLCYRFWKNGVQIDALKVELPPSHPVKDEHLEEFHQVRDSLKNQLNINSDEIKFAVN